MKVAESVENAIKPIFENLDVNLVEVEYVKKHDGMHLVIYLDKESGVTLQDCQEVTKLIDPVIEDLNPTNDASYYLDVSSNGLDRPLKFDWQLDRYMGKKLSVKLYAKAEGLKDFDAILKGYDSENITFEHNKEIVALKRTQIATLLPYIEI